MSITDEFIAAITADVALQLDAITQLGQQVAHRVVARQQQEGTTEQDIDVTLTGLTITLHPTPNIDAFMADHPFVQLAAQPGIQGNDHEQTLTVETAKFGVIELRRAADQVPCGSSSTASAPTCGSGSATTWSGKHASPCRCMK
ncbi:hypothetical protein [Lacticaseibacillus thailandensis]|uniref:hypothetical protein n=1 Tax=Lacticaseibacillus thailandensis TaxID=381741 RepID=UPI0006D2C61B|nr:hypothetical protein [Lacticaseibacillus thailandensis]